jgi:MFS family permease
VVGVALLVIFVLVQALRQARRPLLPFTLFQDRNYALMAAVSVIISIGLVGMALPLTLYLQTALGFSAIKAGLTMAPASLASGFSAPFAGKLADKGGKYLLITGFTLYATGLISICLVAGPASHWYDLVPGYVITGLGVGFTMSPMQTIATRNVDPALAGAASGVLNTTRQTGSALGSAVVLAILQNRLAAHVSYVTAMRSALAFPIIMLLLAAILCTAIRERTLPAPQLTPSPQTPLIRKPESERVLAAPTAAAPARHPGSPAAAFLPAHRRLEATPMTEPDGPWRRWLHSRAQIQPGETVLDVTGGSGLMSELNSVSDASIDVVTAQAILAYVSGQAAALRDIHRLLRPGGRAVLIEPAAPASTGRSSDPGYDLLDLAEAAGFVQLHLELHVDVRAGRRQSLAALTVVKT